MDRDDPTAAAPIWLSPGAFACALLAVALSMYLLVTFDGYLAALVPYLVLAAGSLVYILLHGSAQSMRSSDPTDYDQVASGR